MAHIRKKGKKYSVIIELGKTEEGKRKQKCIGTYDTRKKAQEVLLSTENARLNNTYIEENKITFLDYLDKYFDEEISKKAKSTQEDYRIIYNKYLTKYFENMRLQTLSVVLIQDYFNNYIKDLSPQSIRKHYALLNGAFTKAFKSEIISKNLCDYVTLPKVKKTTKIERLELSEIREILKLSKGTKLEIQINLAINLGMRIGEILALTWKDIDFSKKTISINQSLNVIRSEPIFKEPKTESGNRKLIANKEVMDLLKKELIRQEEEKLEDETFNELDLVCVNKNGRYVHPRTFSKEFAYFLKKHELKNIRFHDLRHANATLMLASGVPPKVASKRLGHATIATTLDIYTDVLKEVESNVADKLESLIYKNK